MSVRVSINGGLEWKFDMTSEELNTFIAEGKPFTAQRMLGDEKGRLVTVNPAFISHFYED